MNIIIHDVLFRELLAKFLAFLSSLTENEHLLFPFGRVIQKIDERGKFVLCRHDFYLLSYVQVLSDVLVPNLDFHWVLAIILCQFLYFEGEGCRKHHRLNAVLRIDLFQNVPYLWLEAHVQQTVCLVDHHILYFQQVHPTLLLLLLPNKKIIQPAGSADQYFAAFLIQFVELGGLSCAAENGNAANK